MQTVLKKICPMHWGTFSSASFSGKETNSWNVACAEIPKAYVSTCHVCKHSVKVSIVHNGSWSIKFKKSALWM